MNGAEISGVLFPTAIYQQTSLKSNPLTKMAPPIHKQWVAYNWDDDVDNCIPITFIPSSNINEIAEGGKCGIIKRGIIIGERYNI